MRIVIHAGRHKTGTTYLQQFLGMNAPLLLKDFDILYPESDRNQKFNYHHEFFQSIVKGGESRTATINKFNREIDEKKPNTVLFSSEYLSRNSIQAKELTAIKESLPECDIEIVFYLRRQDSFLCSRYAEQVKRGLIAYPKTIWQIDAELDYLKFLDRYAKVFGCNNLNVRSYDKAIEYGLIDDFAACLNQPQISRLPKPLSRANNRLPWQYLHILWYANSTPILRKLAASRTTDYFFRKAAKHVPSLFDGKRPITDSEATLLLKRYAESNDAVAKAYTRGNPLFTQ